MSKDTLMLDKVKKAITNIKRGRKKITISGIAEKANIARKTIYDRPELKQLCDQEILIQKQGLTKSLNTNSDVELNRKTESTSRYKLLEKRYKKVQKVNKDLQETNAKLLYNNKELILEKEQLKSKIVLLEEKIAITNDSKVKKMK